MPKRTKILQPVLATAVLIATIGLFVLYYAHHPDIRHQLAATSLPLLAGLLFLYACFVGSLALINDATLRLAGTKMSTGESGLLTIYSSIINFFGPLQSGPAFRAVYLKQKHGISLKKYSAATAVYYLVYAVLSALCLLSGLFGWWAVPIIVIACAATYVSGKHNTHRMDRFKTLALANWRFLALATSLQIIMQIVIYYVELRSIMPHVHISQVVVYTGAANFALFVSITPGAIGFRESFLVFSEKLHHIPSSAIVVANTIDRAAYITVLVLLAVGLFGSQAHNRFKITEKS